MKFWVKNYYFGGLFWPTVLIILGVILLLQNLGLIPADIWKYWPILLVLWGINILLRRAAWSSDKKSFFEGEVEEEKKK